MKIFSSLYSTLQYNTVAYSLHEMEIKCNFYNTSMVVIVEVIGIKRNNKLNICKRKINYRKSRSSEL